MPYDVIIDHDTRTILVRGTGVGSTAETLSLIASQAETFRTCPGYNFLYDAGELQIASSPADMITVADALFGEASAKFRKFAIVVPESRVQLARIFTALAHPHGVDANVFADVSDARAWLGLPG